MLQKWQFYLLTLIAAVVPVLAVANIVLYTQNRDMQSEVTGRAQYVQQSVQLQSLFQEIVKALADLSVRQQDPALRDLLAAQGITINVNAPSATAGEAKTPGEVKKGGGK